MFGKPAWPIGWPELLAAPCLHDRRGAKFVSAATRLRRGFEPWAAAWPAIIQPHKAGWGHICGKKRLVTASTCNGPSVKKSPRRGQNGMTEMICQPQCPCILASTVGYTKQLYCALEGARPKH